MVASNDCKGSSQGPTGCFVWRMAGCTRWMWSALKRPRRGRAGERKPVKIVLDDELLRRRVSGGVRARFKQMFREPVERLIRPLLHPRRGMPVASLTRLVKNSGLHRRLAGVLLQCQRREPFGVSEAQAARRRRGKRNQAWLVRCRARTFLATT